jgi:hypothetical protein
LSDRYDRPLERPADQQDVLADHAAVPIDESRTSIIHDGIFSVTGSEIPKSAAFEPKEGAIHGDYC